MKLRTEVIGILRSPLTEGTCVSYCVASQDTVIAVELEEKREGCWCCRWYKNEIKHQDGGEGKVISQGYVQRGVKGTDIELDHLLDEL